jgi:hypothetical protein
MTILEAALDATASTNGFLEVVGSRATYKNRFVATSKI